jgi:CHAT domain-containing protein/predicted negative regulator of RcsB-dependent stress response
MMFRILRRYCLFLLVHCVSYSQDLETDWQHIMSVYSRGEHDSVIFLIKPFIARMEKQFSRQLSVAYYHLGISLVQTGKFEESDSAFNRARSVAFMAGLSENVKQITIEQLRWYLDAAKKLEHQSPEKALSLYSRALVRAREDGDSSNIAIVLYNRGMCYSEILNKPDAAIQDLEGALEFYRSDTSRNKLTEELRAFLSILYKKAGQIENPRDSVVREDNIKHVIKLAQDEEAVENFQSADSCLQSVQQDVIGSSDRDRVVEFAKKRYLLYEKMGNVSAGIDTLISFLTTVRMMPGMDTVTFELRLVLASIYAQSEKIQEAWEILDDLKKLSDSIGIPRKDLCRYAHVRGDITYFTGDYQSSIDNYRQALNECAAEDEKTRFSILNNLALALSKNGENDEALKTFENLSRQSVDPKLSSFQIEADLNIGYVLMKMEKIEEAIDRLKMAKEHAKANGNLRLEAMSSYRLAEAYEMVGSSKAATVLFTEVRGQQSSLIDPIDRVQILSALGINERNNGQVDLALADLQYAYKLAQTVHFAGYLNYLALDLGDTYFLMDSLQPALQLYSRAMDYFRTSHDLETKIGTHYRLAQCFLSVAKFDSARVSIIRALSFLTKSSPNDFTEYPQGDISNLDLYSRGLSYLAYIDYTEGLQTADLRLIQRALKEVQCAVQLYEKQSLAHLNESLSETQSARNINIYRLFVDIAVRLYTVTHEQTYLEMAFNASEKSRAELYISSLGNQLIQKLSDTAAIELARFSRNYKSSLHKGGLDLPPEYTNGEYRKRGLKETHSSHAPSDAERQRLLAMQDKYDNLIRQLSMSHKNIAQLVTVHSLDLNQAQSFLGENDIMLNYYISLDHCYLFVIAPGEVTLKIIHLTQDQIDHRVEAFRKSINGLDPRLCATIGEELYDSLILPVEGYLGERNLVIVPSGHLNDLPFGALVKDNVYLLERHSISILPNASILQIIGGRSSDRVSHSLLAVGNPANPSVSSLPATAEEVKSIARLYSNHVTLIGTDATEASVKKKMKDFNIVHIATHGIFNYDFPLLSALALAPDDSDDGMLQLSELYNLRLPNTSLVVLSACETGRSWIKKNEDVIGLVRGFFFAGAPSVIASLWQVEDQSTARLFTTFHTLLQKGYPKGEALRRAQLQICKSPETSHPFFWAAFELFGNAN